jgi:beta-lactam-binding protein with PASTA domain
MLKALEGVPASDFPVPPVDLVQVDVDVSRGCLPNLFTPKELIQRQQFIAGTEPKQMCTEPSAPVQSLVPSVVGYPEADGTKLLAQAGFATQRQEEPSLLFPPGSITRQSPAAGSAMASGQTVTIWVARATGGVPVPDVVNLSEAEARLILDQAGFNVDVQRSQGCGRRDEDCFVWDQSPDPGARASGGSTVTIHVKQRPSASPSPSSKRN